MATLTLSNNQKANIKGIGMFSSPFYAEIKDSRNVARTYKEFKLVRFTGDSDSILDFQIKLAETTPTLSGVIESKVNFINAGIELHKGQFEGFDNVKSDTAVTTKDVNEFQGFLSEVFNEKRKFKISSKLTGFTKELAVNYETTGNAWILISRGEIAKERFCRIKSVDMTDVRYIRTKRNEAKRVLISESWDYTYLIRYGALEVPVFPNFLEDENGVEYSIIHVKNKMVGRNWYGLPSGSGSLKEQFLEWSETEYLTGTTATRFSGQRFFDYEDTDDEDGSEDYNETYEQLEAMFTPKGGKYASFGLRARPKGDAPMDVITVPPNTNEKYHEAIEKIVERKIIASKGWFQKLVYERGNGLGGDEIKSLYKIASQAVKPTQALLMNAVNNALSACDEYLETKTFEQYFLKFSSSYKLLIADEQDDTNNSE